LVGGDFVGFVEEGVEWNFAEELLTVFVDPDFIAGAGAT